MTPNRPTSTEWPRRVPIGAIGLLVLFAFANPVRGDEWLSDFPLHEVEAWIDGQDRPSDTHRDGLESAATGWLREVNGQWLAEETRASPEWREPRQLAIETCRRLPPVDPPRPGAESPPIPAAASAPAPRPSVAEASVDDEEDHRFPGGIQWCAWHLAEESVGQPSGSSAEEEAPDVPWWEQAYALGQHGWTKSVAHGRTAAGWLANARWSARNWTLHRKHPGTDVLVTENLAPGLTADAFDFGFKPAWDVSIRGTCRDHECEFRYFDNGHPHERIVLPTDLVNVFQVNTDPPIAVTSGFLIDASYRSALTSAEANVRWSAGRGIKQFAGLRFLELDERLLLFEVEPGTGVVNPLFDVRTRNRLIGGQCGGEWQWLMGSDFRVELLTKLGCYYNRATQDNLALGIIPGEDVSHAVALSGELQVSAVKELPWGFWLRGGWGLLWMGEVALASEQLTRIDPTGAGINNHGEQTFHGLFWGIERQY